MRIPTNISLAAYIRKLIAEDNIAEFYQTDDWKELREEVREEHNNECQECLKYGRYKCADVVHHVNHVKSRPDLALSKYYKDHEGNEHKQLVPLCNACHSVAHPEKGFTNQGKDKYMNTEKW